MSHAPFGDEDDIEFQRALAGRYTIEREIGRGGMGIVYLGREVLLDRPVAIKRLPSRDAPVQTEQRFLREAQTAAKLFHPHIVPVHRAESAGKFAYFAMEFVDGESAGQRVLRHGPMCTADAVKLLRETAWALGYAHARGVVHRDVKPDNLLIERDSHRTIVTDFGIAHDAGASPLTGEGQLLGSVRYMSPEQLGGGPVDGRSDLYALGIVAHFVLVGCVPFDHTNDAVVLGMHLTRTAPPIGSLVSGIPARLASAIDRCLEKDPAARFQTAEAFADAIADAERSQTLPAPLRAWSAGAGLIDAGFPTVLLLSFGLVASHVAPLTAMALPLLYALGQRTRYTRSMFRQGYGTGDLQRALLFALESRSEESVTALTGISPGWVRTVRSISKVAFAIFGLVSVAILLIELGGVSEVGEVRNSSVLVVQLTLMICALGTLAAAVLGTLSAELASPSHLFALPQAAALRLRLRFWKSSFGISFTRLLQAGLRTSAGIVTDRPTEFIIGSAASALFAALPAGTRTSLSEVPRVIARLEEDAQRLRARRDAIERIAMSVQQRPSQAILKSSAVGELRAQTVEEIGLAREVLDRNLATIVAALETIRLDLLRIHAGSGSASDLAGSVMAATRISDQVTSALAMNAT